jgi:predicted enzyme related to lactoylglutathione lyase
VVIDPQGAPLGLVRLAEGDPPDEASPRENRFFWMEYLAGDTSAALTFYTGLLGYQAENVEVAGNPAYQVLRKGRARAGLLPAPPQGVRPAWLSYVLVKDPAAQAARAASLGGKVLLAPRPDVRKGTLAIVADPSGAALALQKWPL